MSQQVIDDVVAQLPAVAAELAHLHGGAPECASVEKTLEWLAKQVPDRALFVEQTVAAYKLL